MAALRSQGHPFSADPVHRPARRSQGQAGAAEHLPDLGSHGRGFAGPSIWGTGLPRMGAQRVLRAGVAAHFANPAVHAGVAHAVCDGFAGGEPLDTCSRQVLKAPVARLAERRPDAVGGHRAEFFAEKSGRWRRGRWAMPHDTLAKPATT